VPLWVGSLGRPFSIPENTHTPTHQYARYVSMPVATDGCSSVGWLKCESQRKHTQTVCSLEFTSNLDGRGGTSRTCVSLPPLALQLSRSLSNSPAHAFTQTSTLTISVKARWGAHLGGFADAHGHEARVDLRFLKQGTETQTGGAGA